MIIYAAVNHHLAEINASDVRIFEKEFLEYMNEFYPEVGNAIKTEGEISEDSENKLTDGINKFKNKFVSERQNESVIQPETE